MFKTIEIEFRDNTKNKAVIDMTKDIDVVMNAIVDVFKEGAGEKFGDAQAKELLSEQTKDVQELLNADFQAGLTKFHQISFDDNSSIMPSFTVNKKK